MNYELILRYTRAYILVVDRSLTVIYNNRGDSGMKLDNPFLIEAVTKPSGKRNHLMPKSHA